MRPYNNLHVNQNMLSKLLNILILKRRKEIPFIIFFSFLMTFIAARLIVLGIQNRIFPKFLDIFFNYIYIKGIHVHHLNFGIIILAITGFFSLIRHNPKHLYWLSVSYGIGLGLTFDEFAIWFTLNDDYWVRTSYDAIIIVSGILLSVVYFPNFWKKIGKMIKK